MNKLPPYVHFDEKKKGTGAYYFVVRIGSRLLCKRGYNSPEEAYIASANIKLNPSIIEKNNITFEYVCKLWIESLRAYLVFETIYAYEGSLNKWIFPYISKTTKYINITDGMLQCWYNSIEHASVLGLKAKNRLITIMRNIYTYSYAYLEIDNKALIRIKNFRNKSIVSIDGKSEHIRFLNIDQFRNLLKQTKDDSFHLMFELAFCCGLRVGEVRGLTGDCLQYGKISITKQVQGKGSGKVIIRHLKTVNSARLITLPPTVLKELELYMINNKIINGFLFYSSRDKTKPIAANTINRFVREIANSCNFYKGISFHIFRHSLATFLDQNEVRKDLIKLWLGHGSTDVTEKYYTHSSSEEIEATVSLIESVFLTKNR